MDRIASSGISASVSPRWTIVGHFGVSLESSGIREKRLNLFPPKLLSNSQRSNFENRINGESFRAYAHSGNSKNRESGLDQISRFLECLSNAERPTRFLIERTQRTPARR